MKTILLKADVRTETGSVSSKNTRISGKVPCVAYGKGENLHFDVYEADFKNLVYTPNVYKVRLNVNNTDYNAILQDMQFHPVNDRILHADFRIIDEKTPVILEVPVKVIGNSPGVRAGGKLVKKINRLKCRGLINDMPDFIELDISKLELGQSFRVKEISVAKLDLLDTQENAIVTIKASRASRSAAADASK